MFLNKHPMVAKADLSSINRLICGAAPLGREMVEEFLNKNPNCDIGQGLSALLNGVVTVLQTILTTGNCCVMVRLLHMKKRRGSL